MASRSFQAYFVYAFYRYLYFSPQYILIQKKKENQNTTVYKANYKNGKTDKETVQPPALLCGLHDKLRWYQPILHEQRQYGTPLVTQLTQLNPLLYPRHDFLVPCANYRHQIQSTLQALCILRTLLHRVKFFVRHVDFLVRLFVGALENPRYSTGGTISAPPPGGNPGFYGTPRDR